MQLSAGIEAAAGDILDRLVGNGQTYLLDVSWHRPGSENEPVDFQISGSDYSSEDSSLELISRSKTELSIYDPDVTETGRFDITITLGIYEV